MQACKIIGAIFGLTGVIVGLAGVIQGEPWAALGPMFFLLARIVSEKIPDWFNLD